MFNPYGADSFILGLVSLTPLLSVGLEAGETLGEMQCAASNTFFPAHPEAEKGMGASGARYSLALCYTGLLWNWTTGLLWIWLNMCGENCSAVLNPEAQAAQWI